MQIIYRFLLFVVVTNNPFISCAQVVDATICDGAVRLPITKYTHFLQTTVPISIDSVARSADRFVKADDKPLLAFNYDPYYYWFKIVVRNSASYERPLMLVMAPFGLFDGKLFQRLNGQWTQVAHTGLKYRFVDRSYQFTHHVFPFTIPAQTTDTLLVSIDATNMYKYFGFALLQPKELRLYENKIYFVFGIIVGLLLLFFVLNVSLFFALKEKLHLWYALYIFLLFLVVMKNDMLDQEFLGLDSEQAFRLTPYMAIGAFAIAVLMHVAQNFLRPKLYRNKILYKITTWLKINVLVSAVVHGIIFYAADNYRVHAIVFSWAKFSTLLAILMIIGNCLYCIRNGLKSAWFILSGSLVFMIGSVQRLVFPITLSFLFPPTTFHIGIIIETFVISMALMYRYWYEKEQQKEREDQIQVLTSNDISEEIHDNVLQDLTVVSLLLRTVDFNNKDTLVNKVVKAQQGVSDMIRHLRHFSRNLKNEPEGSIDLIEQIERACEAMKGPGDITVNLSKQGVPMELASRKQAIIIRIIKGIFQNVVCHAHASVIDVSLVFTQDMLLMEVRDNGIGFEVTPEVLNSNGLKNIRNRCLLLNATYQFESQPGKGTRITFQMPYLY